MDSFNMNDPVNDPTILKTHPVVPGMRRIRNTEIGWYSFIFLPIFQFNPFPHNDTF